MNKNLHMTELNNIEESYIYENCSVCGCALESIEDIWLDVEEDRYVCRYCADEHGIVVGYVE